MSKANGLGTAADFRQLAESAAWTEPERVQLAKSGVAVLLRRPTKFFWALRRAGWPELLREKMEAIAGGEKVELTREEILLLVNEDRKMLEQAFVSPAVSLAPGPEQFDAAFLHEEDLEFVLKHLRGQVLAGGQDLETFPGGEQGVADGGGAIGTDLRPAASGNAEPVSGELADHGKSDRA